jgi:hypothetical protein
VSEPIKFDHAGIGGFLKSAEMHRLIQSVTEEVASNVREQGITVGDRDGGSHEYALPVKSDVTTTDRAHGRVVLAHPAGIAVQAKRGALTKAASQAGLEVKGD